MPDRIDFINKTGLRSKTISKTGKNLKEAFAGESQVSKEKYPPKTYYLCKACGYTASDELPDKCPVCGADKTAFNKF